jgi:hypothetical protein
VRAAASILSPTTAARALAAEQIKARWDARNVFHHVLSIQPLA